MTMCSRCHKRIAVVFMTKIENGETKQDGICIKCARELGIKPVNDMINKMGLTDDDIDKMNAEIENLMEGGGDEMLEGLMGQLGGPPAPVSDDEEADARAPAVDFSKLSGGSAASRIYSPPRLWLRRSALLPPGMRSTSATSPKESSLSWSTEG